MKQLTWIAAVAAMGLSLICRADDTQLNQGQVKDTAKETATEAKSTAKEAGTEATDTSRAAATEMKDTTQGAISDTKEMTDAALSHPEERTAAKESGNKVQTEPVGFILVEESYVADLRELPYSLMGEAKTDFKDKNFGEASSDLEAASRILRAQSKVQKKSDALQAASKELDSLAKDVRDGKIQGENQLTNRLAMVAQKDAEAQRAMASRDWDQGMVKRAGHHLMAAVHATEKGAEWAGKAVLKGSEATVDGAREVAGKLLQGSGWASAEVGKSIQGMGDVIDKWGKEIQPAKTAE